jgi:hypothetical protein
MPAQDKEPKKLPAAPVTGPAKARQPRPVVFLPYSSTGRWHGKVNYQCNSCAFATLDKERILAHVAECATTTPTRR